ncbi:MAG: hypothetical protein R3C56_30490 [Pirellulaceae bacterium]
MKPHSQLTIDLFPGTAQEVNLPSELIDFKAEGEDIGLISFRIHYKIEPVPILGHEQEYRRRATRIQFWMRPWCPTQHVAIRRSKVSIVTWVQTISEIVGAPSMGRSGGELFDMQGRLIGVCNTANAEDDEGIYASAEVVYTQIGQQGSRNCSTKGNLSPTCRSRTAH